MHILELFSSSLHISNDKFSFQLIFFQFLQQFPWV